MAKKIFISHAAKDKKLADLLVDFLETGTPLTSNDIFCSSLEGLGIPTGKNFIEYIKEEIQTPETVILLLSPNYFASQFCLCELGASWALSHNVLPLLVPPLTYDDIEGVLSGIQINKINDLDGINHFIMALKQQILNFGELNLARLDAKKRKFLKKLRKILKELPQPEIVPLEKYKELEKKYSESLTYINKLDRKIDELKKIIDDLVKCKDSEEVNNVLKKYDNMDILEKFDKIVGNIKNILDYLDWEVTKFILSEYYGHPYKIDWFSYGEEFEKSIRYRYLKGDDDLSVNWDNKHMKKLEKYLNDLSALLEDNEDYESLLKLYEKEYSSDLEPENQEFWEEHYR
jgi:hypothetical protein